MSFEEIKHVQMRLVRLIHNTYGGVTWVRNLLNTNLSEQKVLAGTW